MGIESVIDPEYTQAVDARLASYDAYIEYQMQEARRTIPFLSKFFPIQGARVLEVGTGRGGKGIAYACEGMNVTALDVDAPSLELGAQAAHARDASIRFLVGDGTRLPFPADHFDAILIDSVIEHVGDPQALLTECQRVLRRGGIVFVVFPPFYGPLSGHIDDYVMIPWFHLLPRGIVEKMLMSRPQQKGILAPRGAFEVYCSLNGLTIFQFKHMSRRAGFGMPYFRVRPFLTHPGTRLAVGLLSALRHRPRRQNLSAVLGRARREFDLGTFLLFILLSAISPLVFVPILQEIAAGGCKCVLRKAVG
jgi:ubiquinone/menaquinone biosynthesis C-methylase UbiE